MRDCRKVRKYLYAFADGQFDVKINCDLLDHLKMCPQCTRIVDEHQSLREALKRVGASVSVPASLGHEVRAALAPRARSAKRSTWRGRVAAGLLAAACIGSAMYTAWDVYGPKPQSQSGGTVASEGFAVSRVAYVHAMCIQKGDAHQDPNIPRDIEGMRAAYAARFQSQINVLVPDLSEYGFELESAGICGVQCGQVGAHLIYHCGATSNRCSLFSVPRIPCMDLTSEGAWYEHRVEQSDKSFLYVLAWCDDGRTTHICCSPVEPEQMKKWMAGLRPEPNGRDCR